MKIIKIIGLFFGMVFFLSAQAGAPHSGTVRNDAYLIKTDWSAEKRLSYAATKLGISASDLDRYGKQRSILQLERQFKNNGSLMSTDRYALQARLNRVAEAIRNFKSNDRNSVIVDKKREYAQHGEQTFQYINDDPKKYLGK